MLLLGVLLIVGGLALAYFSEEFGRAAKLAFMVGAVLALAGVVLIVVEVFDLGTGGANAGVLAVPFLAMAVPPSRPRRGREAAGNGARAARKSKLPTRKWWVAQVVALAGIATSWVDSGWDDLETKLVIGWAVQAFATWMIPNENTPGGVPLKE